MTNKEVAQLLWDRIRQPKHTMDELVRIFNEYKTAVTSMSASDSEHRAALHYLPQEWPDLDRLIAKGHDVILKGRLVDAISKLKKKVSELDEPPAAEKDEIPKELLDEAPPIRNMPNLGME